MTKDVLKPRAAVATWRVTGSEGKTLLTSLDVAIINLHGDEKAAHPIEQDHERYRSAV